MYTALELMQRAFYAAHYARLQKAGGADPSNMIEAAHYYLNRLYMIEHTDFTNTIKVVEGMLKGVEG